MPKSSSPRSRTDDESPTAHNSEVERALKEYCNFPHPQGFAVMLRGRWGSGKTHFIKSILDSLVSSGKDAKKHRPLYVSLYGVEDPAEIGDQFFQQLHPFLGHKATRLVGSVLRSTVRATIKVDIAGRGELDGSLPDLDLSSMLSGSKGRVIVFDDFERAEMVPVALLGYINPLVEHDDCKVVVVADETQISKENEYWKRKEKTIGRTLEFRADADAAFDAFTDLIDIKAARTFLAKAKGTILEIFADSDFDNLRLLKHFLWDFERLWKILTPEERKNEQAMHELLALLCAWDIELRSGELTEEALETEQGIEKVFGKYPTVRFSGMLLNPATIVDFVLKSKLPIERIKRQLRQHPYFAKLEEIPSWRALWLSMEAPLQEHQHIVERFESDFAARRFRAKAEINHVIGLSLWLSEMGFPGWEEPGVLEKIKAYIADVYSAGEVGFDELNDSPLDDISGGAFGLAYKNSADPRFAELTEYLRQQRVARRQRAYPAFAARLHELMTENSEAFLRDVCFTEGGGARFARLSILKEIPAEQFAKTFVSAPFRDQSQIAMALSIRYEQTIAEPELQAEVPWLSEVRQHLYRLKDGLPRIARYQLSLLLARLIHEAWTN
jgi:hypothetical protein